MKYSTEMKKCEVYSEKKHLWNFFTTNKSSNRFFFFSFIILTLSCSTKIQKIENCSCRYEDMTSIAELK